MAFKNFNNNVQNVGIVNVFTDTTPSIILASWFGDLFPLSNGRITVELRNTSSVVVKREVIDYTLRTVDTLSWLTRSVEVCVQDDSVSPRIRTQNVLDFTPWVGQTVTVAQRYTEGNDKELKDTIDLKADDADVVHNTWDEDIEDTKTFITNTPKTPIAPVDPDDIVNKDYVDDAIAVASAIWSLTETCVLWEEVVAWDLKWATFYWKWDTKTTLVTQYLWATELLIGNVDANTRQWILLKSANSLEAYDYIDSIILDLRKQGSPTDNLQFTLYEDNKTTLVAWWTVQSIVWSSLATTFSVSGNYLVIDGQKVVINKFQDYFLEVKRSGANNAANYYAIRSHTSNVIYGWSFSYTGSTSTWSALNTNSVFYGIQYWRTYATWSVWLSDTRYTGTNKRDAIITQSWLATESKLWTTSGALLWTWPFTNWKYWLNSLPIISLIQWQQATKNTTFLIKNWLTTRTAVIQDIQFAEDIALYTYTIEIQSNNPITVPVVCELQSDSAWTPSWTILMQSTIDVWSENTVIDFVFFGYVLQKNVKYRLKTYCTTSTPWWINLSVSLSNANVSTNTYWTQQIVPTPWPFIVDNTKDLYYLINRNTTTSVNNTERAFNIVRRWYFGLIPTNSPYPVATQKTATRLMLCEASWAWWGWPRWLEFFTRVPWTTFTEFNHAWTFLGQGISTWWWPQPPYAEIFRVAVTEQWFYQLNFSVDSFFAWWNTNSYLVQVDWYTQYTVTNALTFWWWFTAFQTNVFCRKWSILSFTGTGTTWPGNAAEQMAVQNINLRYNIEKIWLIPNDNVIY